MSIICGPIVRHCNRSEINIWMVIDTATDAEAFTLKTFADNSFSQPIDTPTKSSSIQLGEHCFAVMLTTNLPPDHTHDLIYYDIEIDGQGFHTDNDYSNAEGFYQHICLGSDKLPSIALPKRHHNICQASCRKPHDKGIDQLSDLANHLEHELQTSKRPSQLFLTGDQIYADDVSPILLESFEAVREELGLSSELMSAGAGKLFDPDRLKLDTRNNRANKSSGFSSGESDSHLLSFAEYLCMYLFSFSGMLPKQKFARYNALKIRLSFKQHHKNGRHTRLYNFTATDYAEQLSALTHFAETVGQKVRKLLANISVYMMFDDHDVTDDWNLTQENYTSLSTSPLGRQVYVNALAAYAVCQHWGNQPADLSDSIKQQISQLALTPTLENHQPLESLFSKYWGYLLEQTPPALVLDTRTQRVYNGQELQLMSVQRLSSLGQKLSQLPACQSLILVSPTPVFGFTRLEGIQLKLPKFLANTFDREPWVASKTAWKALQQMALKLPGIKHTLILSGDVHYAFCRRQYLADKAVTFWQLTSSAAANSPVGGNIGVPLLEALGHHFKKNNTKYLEPEKGHILTCDKNVGLLQLDDTLTPSSTTLLCSNSSGERYKKYYNLVDYSEYP